MDLTIRYSNASPHLHLTTVAPFHGTSSLGHDVMHSFRGHSDRQCYHADPVDQSEEQ